MQLWCGFGEDPEVGQLMVAPVMEAVYQSSFDAFARYTPTGTPAQVAEYLQPHVEASCRTFNLFPHGGNPDEPPASVGQVRRLLDTSPHPPGARRTPSRPALAIPPPTCNRTKPQAS